jgi:endonuclease/exonuclease/phosphatase family metal-dependent hydrolase
VQLTVMTHNVGNGLADPGRLATLLLETDADIVGLQELAAVQAELLADGLRSVYSYQVLAPRLPRQGAAEPLSVRTSGKASAEPRPA